MARNSPYLSTARPAVPKIWGYHCPFRAVAARSEVVRLNSSVGLPAVQRNAWEARCCKGVWGYPPIGISGLLRCRMWRRARRHILPLTSARGLYRSAAVGTARAQIYIYGYSATSHADSALPVHCSAGMAS